MPSSLEVEEVLRWKKKYDVVQDMRGRGCISAVKIGFGSKNLTDIMK